MRRTVDLDSELEIKLSDVVSLTKQKPSVVIRQALRAGLPEVANRLQSHRPSGYFAGDYGPDEERVALESAMGKVRQKPER
jgi:metal-responsive CopG/Arc/MetJ family transcriptional regulator